MPFVLSLSAQGEAIFGECRERTTTRSHRQRRIDRPHSRLSISTSTMLQSKTTPFDVVNSVCYLVQKVSGILCVEP